MSCAHKHTFSTGDFLSQFLMYSHVLAYLQKRIFILICIVLLGGRVYVIVSHEIQITMEIASFNPCPLLFCLPFSLSLALLIFCSITY